MNEYNAIKIVLATSLWARLAGLLDRRCAVNGEALLLVPCNSIHTFGLNTAIDVAFIDSQARVLAVERNLAPGHLRSHRQAVAVLERRSSDNNNCPWPGIGQRLNLQGDKEDQL